MARLLKTYSGLSIALDNSVGKGGQNFRSDVGSVQFALKLASKGVVGPFGASGQMPGFTMGETIAVDGIYGPQTARFIDAYQQLRSQAPSPSLGSMPPPTGQFAGRYGGGWSFGVLENDAENSAGCALVDALARDSTAPAWLKAEFLSI